MYNYKQLKQMPNYSPSMKNPPRRGFEQLYFIIAHQDTNEIIHNVQYTY